MPHEDSTLTRMKIKGPGYSLPMAGWIARLIILDLVFIAAVTGVLVVLLQALWDYIHCAMTAGAGVPSGSCLPPSHGLRR
jgi:hypothetical protein